jgi:hypothetical protein
MTCSILSFQKCFFFFHQLTRLMIRWLAGESAAFHQLTGCKIALCAGESSALAQNEILPPKLWFHQKLNVSLLYPLACSQQPELALANPGVTFSFASIF